MDDMPRDADKATTRLEAAIQRHAGWQLEYDFAIVIRDRKRLLARIAELEAERERHANLWLAGGEAREIHLETTDSHTLRQFQSPVRLTEVLQAAATGE